MATERVLSNLNLISFKTEGGLQNHIDELQEGDLAFTPDNSLKGVLFDFKWADHLLDDISWLRADTFSWQSGDVYVAAYNHLVDDAFSVTINGEKYYKWDVSILSGITYYTKSFAPNQGDIVYEKSGTGEMVATEYTVTSVAGNELTLSDGSIVRADLLFVFTDTIGDTTITYYRAADGHKICLPDQEDKILALYNATGVAWYYILDTANKQFKLPRTKFGVTGLRDEVGGYVPESLPNVTGGFSAQTVRQNIGSSWGAFDRSDTGVGYHGGSDQGNFAGSVNFDASLSSPTYQDNAPVQERATQMYLYFYVGNFERDAVEQTAGITVETLNGKADSDLGNIPANYDYVIESQMPTAENSYTWYRKYKSGWIEQGGRLIQSGSAMLPIEMSNNNYNLQVRLDYNSTGTIQGVFWYATKTTTGFTMGNFLTEIPLDWQVSGMAAQ